jgi:hypothetical protein
MDAPFPRAQHYFDQANNMRQLGRTAETEIKREMLLELAKGYEKLCAKSLALAQHAMNRSS